MRQTGLFVLSVLVGVFSGIWMDYHAEKQVPAPRSIVFTVQDYQKANLEIFPGDSVALVDPKGNKSDLLMNFVGGTNYSPCTGGASVNPCVIKSNASAGPFFFTCSSQKSGYTCPEPGVQQSPGGPVPNQSYSDFVARDFSHLFVFGYSRGTGAPLPVKTNPHPATTTAVNAFVSCSGANSTQLLDLNGNPFIPANTITVKTGQTAYWISSSQFSLNTSTFPANLCQGGNPGNGLTQQEQCDIPAQNPQLGQYQYSVQAQSCNASTAPLVVAQ